MWGEFDGDKSTCGVWVQIVERYMRGTKFGAILGGSEEIMADLGIRQAMKNYPLHAKL